MTFGEKLQKLRRESALSQEKLAEQLHVSRQAISKWELGTAAPDTDNIVRLSKFFQVPLEYLMLEDCTDPSQAIGWRAPAPGAAGGASGTGKTAFLVDEGQADLVCSGGIPVGILDFFVQL